MNLKREPGLVVSAAFHVLALGLSAGALSSPKPFNVQVESLPVEILSPKEFDQITRGEKTAKSVTETKAARVEKLNEIETPKPDAAPLAKQDVVTPTRVNTPKPQPQDDRAEDEDEIEDKPKPAKTTPQPQPKVAEPEPKKPEPKPEPKLAEAKPEPKPEPKKPDTKPEVKKEPAKPEPKKLDDIAKKLNELPDTKAQKAVSKPASAQENAKPFDASKVAALLDKREPSRTASTGRQVQTTASLGSATGTAAKLSVSQRSAIDGAIRDHLSSCWNPPYTAGADKLNVRVRFALKQDGSLEAQPQILNTNADPMFRAQAESALRAVRKCSPFKLPAEHYAYWQNVEVNFDPKDMFGG